MKLSTILPEIILGLFTVGILSLIFTIMPPEEFLIIFTAVALFKALKNFKPEKNREDETN